MTDVVEIATFGTTFEARTAAAHLKSEGIRSSVVTDNAGGAIPSMSLLEGGVRLVTTAEDAERARDILNDLDEEVKRADQD
ncbi:MAG: DUF2007 domain-containing protein [Actinomycetia bacterium]|nr:DUF2007 domain-containing protein [Actinomycetes bacterium]